MPFESLTLAIFLIAELGFLGVAVFTAVHTPLFWGEFWSIALRFFEFQPFRSAGALAFFSETSLPLRTNWLNVGNSLHLLAQKIYMFSGHIYNAPINSSLFNFTVIINTCKPFILNLHSKISTCKLFAHKYLFYHSKALFVKFFLHPTAILRQSDTHPGDPRQLLFSPPDHQQQEGFLSGTQGTHRGQA